MLAAALRALAAGPAAGWCTQLPSLTQLSLRLLGGAPASVGMQGHVTAAAGLALPAGKLCWVQSPGPVQQSAAWRSLACISSCAGGASRWPASSMQCSSGDGGGVSGAQSSSRRWSSGSGSGGGSTVITGGCAVPAAAQKQAEAAAQSDPLQPPEEPGPDDCCGRGCGDL